MGREGEKFCGGKNCVFPPPLFFKGKMGPEVKGLLGLCSAYNGKPLMNFEQRNNSIWFVF